MAEVDERTKDFLILTSCVSFALFIISEILGMSSCEYNGVFHFVISGCSCLGRRKMFVDVRIEESENDETTGLLNQV